MVSHGEKSILRKIVTHPAFLLVAGFIIAIFTRIAIEAPAQAFLPEPGRTGWQDLLISCAVSGMGVFTLWLIVCIIDRKSFSDLSLPGWLKEWGYGAAVGTGAMTAVVAVIAVLGGYKIVGHNGPEVLIGVLSMAIISGVWEEVVIRGIIFKYLEQWLGSIAALALSALLFGALHLGNPNSSWLAAIAIALEAGILLGAIYMLTRRLWAAIGLHMAWNSVQGGVFGVAVSGTEVKGFLVSKSSGPDILSGGAFGAEASLPAILICTAIGFYFLLKAYQKGRVVNASWYRFKTGEAAPVE
jgi:uncharacterized protein